MENDKENVEKNSNVSNMINIPSQSRQTETDQNEIETGVTALNTTTGKSKGKPGRKRKIMGVKNEDVIDDFLIVSYSTLGDLEVCKK